jgi:hypothetical protein
MYVVHSSVIIVFSKIIERNKILVALSLGKLTMLCGNLRGKKKLIYNSWILWEKTFDFSHILISEIGNVF